MRIAIMQPYFVPYLGYLRLLNVDKLIIYDCVQFVRRGRIHRNELYSNRKYTWLTLPLIKPGYYDAVKDVRLAYGYQEDLARRIKNFDNVLDVLARYPELTDVFFQEEQYLNKYLGNIIKYFAKQINLNCSIHFSSELQLGSEYKGVDRIIKICEAFNATEYVNVAGGLPLYLLEDFSKHDISLMFLKPYSCGYDSIIDVLINKTFLEIRDQILAEVHYYNNDEVRLIQQGNLGA